MSLALPMRVNFPNLIKIEVTSSLLRPFQCSIYSRLHSPLSSTSNPYRCLKKMTEMTSPSSSTLQEPSREEVIARLKQLDATDMLAELPPLPASVTRAAVLLPLFYRDDKLHILLTVRSSNLKSHRGDVAFPGGKCDEGDADFKATALREAEEEVGLAQDQVQVISQLGPSFSLRRTLVIPVVGFIPDDFCPVPNPAEVQDVFSLPVVNFVRPVGHVQRLWKEGGESYTINFFGHNEGGKRFVTYGLTAGICIFAASVCFACSPQFKSNVVYDTANPRKLLQLSHDSYMKQVKKLEHARLKGNL